MAVGDQRAGGSDEMPASPQRPVHPGLPPVTGAADWDAVKASWQQLEADDPRATIFHTWHWQSCFWEAVLSVNPAWKTWIVRLQDDAGNDLSTHGFSLKTQSVGPFTERSLYCTGSPHRDYGGGLYRGGRTDVVPGLVPVVRDLPWDRLVLDALSLEEAEALSHGLNGAGLPSRTLPDAPMSDFPLEPDADQVLHRVRGKSALKNSRAKQRRLERAFGPMRFESFTDPPAHVMDAFFDMHCRQWGRPSKFHHPGHRQFFVELCRRRVGCVLDAVFCGGQPLAMLFGFTYRHRYAYYTPTYDARYAAYSPGQLLIQEVVRRRCEEGCRVFDFLRGAMSYKYDYPVVEVPRWRVEAFRTTPRGTMSRLARKALDALSGTRRRVTP